MGKAGAKSIFLSMLVLFSILYQSFHVWEHSAEQDHTCLSENHDENFTMEQDSHVSCSVCVFSFQTDDFSFDNNLIPENISAFFNKKSTAVSEQIPHSLFSGLFRLRAPPALI